MSTQEGTTQGCPLAMAMYALAIVPLVSQLHGLCKQVWFADDGTGAGNLKELRKWWDKLVDKRPAYGYFPNASKTWLIVKDEKLDEAKRIFKGTGVKFTSEGKRHLGAVIGSQTFKKRVTFKRKLMNGSLMLSVSLRLQSLSHRSLSLLSPKECKADGFSSSEL